MSWRNKLIDASYKNVHFKVKSHDLSGGRRTQLHQFANREVPYLQDNGKKADINEIEGYIVQNIENDYDYFSERDNLLRVLKSSGSGTLFHPYLGILQVGVTDFSMNETFEEGGIAKFTISFAESGERALPKVLTDFFGMVDNAVNEAMDLVGDVFVIAYSTVGLFQDTTSNTIQRTIGAVQNTLSAMGGISTKIISESLNNVSTIQDLVPNSINDATDIFNILKNCCYSLASACGMGSVLLEEQQSSKGFAGSGSVALEDKATDNFVNKITISTNVTGGETGGYSGITRGKVTILDPNSIEENLGKSVINGIVNAITNFDMSGYGLTPTNQTQNVALLLDTFNFQMISTVCRIAIRTNFTDQIELLEYMNSVVDMINQVLLDMGATSADGTSAIGIGTDTDQIKNKDIFLSIQNIRRIFIDSMIEKASFIAKSIDYIIPPDVETSLELAYDKYEDLDRSNEIFSKNRELIGHPGFLPGGDVIRILNA